VFNHICILKEILNYFKEATYFNRVDIVDRLIYVFVPYVKTVTPQQEIDIFSLDGKYLYRGFIRVGSDLNIVFSAFKNLIIKNNYSHNVCTFARPAPFLRVEILFAMIKIRCPTVRI
jgi:hypothetical protein